jgi:tRNA A37 threonylcarbamoyladenosine dehydratase
LREEVKKHLDAIHADSGAHKKRQTAGSVSFVPSVVWLILAGGAIRDMLQQTPKIVQKPMQ